MLNTPTPKQASLAQIELAWTWQVSRETSASKSHASFSVAFIRFPGEDFLWAPNDRKVWLLWVFLKCSFRVMKFKFSYQMMALATGLSSRWFLKTETFWAWFVSDFIFPIKNRAVWKSQITCLKSRDYNSSAPVKYIPKTSSKVKLSETSPQVKSLEKSSCSSRADVSAAKVNGGNSVRAKIAYCEASQSLNEMQNSLLFGGSRQGKVLLTFAHIITFEFRTMESVMLCNAKCTGINVATSTR